MYARDFVLKFICSKLANKLFNHANSIVPHHTASLTKGSIPVPLTDKYLFANTKHVKPICFVETLTFPLTHSFTITFENT